MKTQEKDDVITMVLEHFLKTGSTDSLKKFHQIAGKRTIPTWYIAMLNDRTRNEFYHQEIKNQVKDKVVLDLGAGCGLMTLLALKEGARHVYALEREPVMQTCLSHILKEEIAQGKVTLINKSSYDLMREDFIHDYPQIVIHEIFANDILSEGFLELYKDLQTRQILTPELTYIPQRFRMIGSLYHSDQVDDMLTFHDPELKQRFGFMEKLMVFENPISFMTSADFPGHDVGPSFDIFNLDTKDPCPLTFTQVLKVNATKPANYLRLWFELQGLHGTLSTDIEKHPNHWGNRLYLLRFEAGEVIIKAQYEDRLLTFNICGTAPAY